ncbi:MULTISPECIES: AraC family transcriptional regulator ligand-binding domain-containing protein [unclassified Nocardioides]|uniref:AraC family transcriptional regulator ligand-binding domain-containing protein n=1 Tax=unclassified Nocardioides TaxID=2615069 RepID=UPI003613E0EA
MAGDRFDLEPSMKALLRDLGLSTVRVLRRAQLPADLFTHRPLELTVEEYYRFWDAVDAEAVGAGRPDVAVDIGHAISPEMFSPPIFAALCSPTLQTAATRIAAHKPLVGPLRVDIDTDNVGRLAITFRWPPGASPPGLLATAELTFWVALARIGTREPVRPVRVTAPDGIRRTAALRDYLGVPVSKGADLSLTFNAVDAARRFLTENDQMWRFFAPELRRRLHNLQADVTVADRVRAALLEALPAGDPSIDSVTGSLAVSARTLQRQLKAEGTTFQAVLADTRESLARHYLQTGDLRTPEIAYLLGYEDTNSFYRAFKSWTGATPDSLRMASA